MDKRNFHRLKMLNNVDEVLISNENIWTTSAVFKKVYQRFVADKKEINDYDQQTDKGISTTAKKDQWMQIMLDCTLLGAANALVYAISENDNELKTLFDHTKSSLTKGNEIEICNNCHKIFTDIVKIEDKLVPDYIPAEDLIKMKEAIETATNLLDKPQGVRRKRKTNKENMEKAFKRILDLLKDELDKLMLNYKVKYPDFYTQYSNARVIGGWKKKKDDEDEDTPETENESDNNPTE